MKVGQVFYSKQKDSKWLVWHEVTEINGETVTLSTYGHDHTDSPDVVFRKKEIQYSIRKGILIPA